MSKHSLWDQLIQTYQDMNVPYPTLRHITIAQWALESNFGQSDLATKHFNFAGLKYRKRMEGFAEPIDYTAHDGEDVYCAFEDIESFVGGYWHFLHSGPYGDLSTYQEDPLGFIKHLHTKGYAVDPNYVQKVTALFDRLSDEYGWSDELDRPSRSQYDETRESVVYEIVPGEYHKTKGNYAQGNIDGVIVHYDAGRIRRKYAANEDSDYGSRSTIQWGADKGYRFMCISRTGRVFVPENWDLENWGSHAGRSKCTVEKDRTWVSQYYPGIEMNNPGLLYEAQEDGVFCPYYNSKRYPKGHKWEGNVILDKRKRCYRVDAKDEWFNKNEVRYVSGDHLTDGYYLPYTHVQYEALKAVLMDMIYQKPSIRTELIQGHDEVSPGRKQDPGGALGYPGELRSMAQLRAEIHQLRTQTQHADGLFF